ncbi:MAG: glycosyltransferase [Chitinophagaceae bacterium]
MKPFTNDDSKPTLIIFPFNLLSHYLRCLMLARYLSPYFRIVFANSKEYSRFIQDEGFESFECLCLDAKEVMKSVIKFDFSWMNEKDLEAVFTDQVRVIKQLEPHVILADTSPSVKMAAEKTGVIFVEIMNGYMSKYYTYGRKISRTHPVYPLIKMLPLPLITALTNKGEEIAMDNVHRPFKKIRKKYALSRKSSYLDELEGDINIICDLEELFPQKTLPHNYVMMAPLYNDPPENITEFVEKLDSTRKSIFISMGSTGDWQKMVFLNEPVFARYNVVTAGDDLHVLNADHIIQQSFVNFHELFPQIDLVICHGGNGTIYQALYYGIPLLCKTNHFDQEWNVAALERCELGRSLDEINLTTDYLDVIEEWIAEKHTSKILPVFRKRMFEEKDKMKSTIEKVTQLLFSVTVGTTAKVHQL